MTPLIETSFQLFYAADGNHGNVGGDGQYADVAPGSDGLPGLPVSTPSDTKRSEYGTSGDDYLISDDQRNADHGGRGGHGGDGGDGAAGGDAAYLIYGGAGDDVIVGGQRGSQELDAMLYYFGTSSGDHQYELRYNDTDLADRATSRYAIYGGSGDATIFIANSNTNVQKPNIPGYETELGGSEIAGFSGDIFSLHAINWYHPAGGYPDTTSARRQEAIDRTVVGEYLVRGGADDDTFHFSDQ
ncbi:MAG: hypothetical protein GY947_20415 [Rhodobacteraceae bacterium]|nr:hypothetical protein [Paracoccaceae bacterium]